MIIKSWSLGKFFCTIEVKSKDYVLTVWYQDLIILESFINKNTVTPEYIIHTTPSLIRDWTENNLKNFEPIQGF